MGLFELQKAVEKGYNVVNTDEVWHFPNKTDTLFKDYVKTFLKCKQEASGYPGHVKTAEEKRNTLSISKGGGHPARPGQNLQTRR